MDFWQVVVEVEKSISASIQTNNALKLREESKLCASLIEIAKFSMSIGRVKRALAYLFVAKFYWDNHPKAK